mmetsp:Transcript_2810/g.8714  ORF Transcript_2810/g.8714 Transcript_2810/m.8714 type:complete len:233 (-) Transcript_2810:1379-2077(-)
MASWTSRSRRTRSASRPSPMAATSAARLAFASFQGPASWRQRLATPSAGATSATPPAIQGPHLPRALGPSVGTATSSTTTARRAGRIGRCCGRSRRGCGAASIGTSVWVPSARSSLRGPRPQLQPGFTLTGTGETTATTLPEPTTAGRQARPSLAPPPPPSPPPAPPPPPSPPPPRRRKRLPPVLRRHRLPRDQGMSPCSTPPRSPRRCLGPSPQSSCPWARWRPRRCPRAS